jgi:predicted ATPase
VEKRLFRRMGVFQGGCSLESIEVACSDDAGSVLDDLGSLVDVGLIQIAGPGDRFQMLQTIREYALEELQAAEETELIGDRHAAYFAEVAAHIGGGIEGTDQIGSIERGVLEDADLRAGLTS